MTMTQVAGSPPNNTNKSIAADYPDDIRALGDQIADLTVLQAHELAQYLEKVHGYVA